MKKSITNSFLLATSLLASAGHADNMPSNHALLEAQTVTIRTNGIYPLIELQPCPNNCPTRLLSFAPGAQVFIRGKTTSLNTLQDGQVLFGTVFINSGQPPAIRKIIAE
ncbi:hypothetical protein EQ836_10885 [Ectopseudomonas mendocina]|uniref:Uncharacterized protein n=1 Tax=Ectopseudomonas mendocina TaxID=300 RepID=A0ABD7RVC4_ECTME|nr:hypothetical protein [Pseudomonas mendocina]TRO15272.1 hypothetical protein EQ829_08065 [Pseudomonas mendocina]TRO18068.1 hypothetical protein EQ836_10885 [Pseudomonas mendocina]